jgi:integrase
VTIFTAWCSDAGEIALPAVAATVAAFIDAMAALKAPATVRRYVSSVATFHRAAGVANPCETQAVKLALKRMHRERGRAQVQAAPVNDVLVARMLAAAGDTLRHRRNRALLAVAYSTLCRRSELVVLRHEDLQVDAEGFGTITIRRSKTDQEGAGQTIGIPRGNGMCPVRALREWLDAAGIESGPVFERIMPDRKRAGRLSPAAVAAIVKSAAIAIGLDPTRFAGHSLRSGFATSASAAGADLAQIMAQTRHKSEAVARGYVQRGSVFHNRAVRALDL